MKFPSASYTHAPQPPPQQWPGVCLIRADEALSCSNSDGASRSTCSSVCTSADWESSRGRCSETWTEKAGMQEAWKTEAALSAQLQQERNLQQQFFSRYAQHQQQANSCGMVQQQQQVHGRQDAQRPFAQHLQGTAAVAASALQQHCMQQPLQQGLPSYVLQQQAPPLLLQQEQRLQQQHLEQRCLQQPSILLQYQPNVLPAVQQPTLQQHLLRSYTQQEQHMRGCSWPSAKRERSQGDPGVRLTVSVMKYRCQHATPLKGRKRECGVTEALPPNGAKSELSPKSVPSTNSSRCSVGSNAARSSRRGESGGSSVSSSMLFWGGKRAEKGSQKKNEEAGGCVALQAFTVTYSAAVPVSLLESLPLFGCMHSEIFGTPQRVVLLAFEQEDHVSAEALWRLLDFCSLLNTHTAAAVFCKDAGTATDDANTPDSSHEAAPTCSASAVSGVAAAAAQFVARMPVEQLLMTYAGCLLLLNKLQGPQQPQVATEENKEQQHPATTLPQPFMHAQQQQPLLHPQQQQHSSYTQPKQPFVNSQWQQQQQRHYIQAQGEQGHEQQHESLLQTQQQQWVEFSQGYRLETGNPAACITTAAAGGTSSSRQATPAADQQKVAPLVVLQHVRDAGAAKLERLLDEALLPVCCSIAHRYDDLRLLESCYWLLRHILLEKGLPPEWKEPSPQQQQAGTWGAAAATAAPPVGAETSSEQQQQQQPESASDIAAHQREQGRCTEQQVPQRQEQEHPHQSPEPVTQQEQPWQQQQQQLFYCRTPCSPPQVLAQQQPVQNPLPVARGGEVNGDREGAKQEQAEDDSWMPPSLFSHCTGRKACFSVQEATLHHLSYSVPLTVFWKVVAEEVRRKSAYLAEPRGYLHCEIHRLRTPSGSSFVYPHTYFLFADAASCRQLGLQQQLAMQRQQQPQQHIPQQQKRGAEEQRKAAALQQQEGRMMLLFGRRQYEYSAVDFFLPSPALLEAASRCCFASEQEGVKEREGGAHQGLLAAAGAAEIYGKDYLGTLHAGFWGTRFSLKHWGMKQPCKLEGGEGLPSPLAVTSETDTPDSFPAAPAAVAASSVAATAAASVSAAASSSTKVIYTRLVRVYQQPPPLHDMTLAPAEAPAAPQQQVQQQYVQQQQYTWQHQLYTGQQQCSLLEQYTLQQQAANYVLHQQQRLQPQQQQHRHQQQDETVQEDVRYGETWAAPGTQSSSGADLCSSQQQEQQRRVSAEEERSPAKNGVPFFFSCSRSHDEALPAAGEVAEVSTAEQLHVPMRGNSSGAELRTETAAAARAAAPASRRGSSTQEELHPIHSSPQRRAGLSTYSWVCCIYFALSHLEQRLSQQLSSSPQPLPLLGRLPVATLRLIHDWYRGCERHLPPFAFELVTSIPCYAGTNCAYKKSSFRVLRTPSAPVASTPAAAALLRPGGSYNLESVKPRWDESIRAYSLPFFGRAKLTSAKNVQLTPSRVVSSSNSGKKRSNPNFKTKWSSSNRREAGQAALRSATSAPAAAEEDEAEDEEANTSIYLMMGKLSKDVFALDFRAPVRIFEAFAIAAATLAKKRAVS